MGRSTPSWTHYLINLNPITYALSQGDTQASFLLTDSSCPLEHGQQQPSYLVCPYRWPMFLLGLRQGILTSLFLLGTSLALLIEVGDTHRKRLPMVLCALQSSNLIVLDRQRMSVSSLYVNWCRHQSRQSSHQLIRWACSHPCLRQGWQRSHLPLLHLLHSAW